MVRHRLFNMNATRSSSADPLHAPDRSASSQELEQAQDRELVRPNGGSSSACAGSTEAAESTPKPPAGSPIQGSVGSCGSTTPCSSPRVLNGANRSSSSGTENSKQGEGLDEQEPIVALPEPDPRVVEDGVRENQEDQEDQEGQGSQDDLDDQDELDEAAGKAILEALRVCSPDVEPPLARHSYRPGFGPTGGRMYRGGAGEGVEDDAEMVAAAVAAALAWSPTRCAERRWDHTIEEGNEEDDAEDDLDDEEKRTESDYEVHLSELVIVGSVFNSRSSQVTNSCGMDLIAEEESPCAGGRGFLTFGELVNRSSLKRLEAQRLAQTSSPSPEGSVSMVDGSWAEKDTTLLLSAIGAGSTDNWRLEDGSGPQSSGGNAAIGSRERFPSKRHVLVASDDPADGPPGLLAKNPASSLRAIGQVASVDWKLERGSTFPQRRGSRTEQGSADVAQEGGATQGTGVVLSVASPNGKDRDGLLARSIRRAASYKTRHARGGSEGRPLLLELESSSDSSRQRSRTVPEGVVVDAPPSSRLPKSTASSRVVMRVGATSQVDFSGGGEEDVAIPYDTLAGLGKQWPRYVNPACREEWLSPEEFVEVFGMSYASFRKFPWWRRRILKQQVDLF